ncbi:DNA-binding transcriptional regulator, IclR family [Arthrobacter alpinus]|uniref:DNA-binding transcriptional regulator, IclR family n=1 Tax=Arthrobacter alpinus TaxID=656366 RepID=A0A1H5LBU8_9MICC|nr:IclR family transcriptional regulator [Arthrobacter alpinus]SEE73851.1 DNA-binding transcriptional regulator, IclR family [Arthrobacter alpinus]
MVETEQDSGRGDEIAQPRQNSVLKPPGGLGRALEILLQFASSQVLTAAQLSSRTGIPVSAVYRHLSALTQSGLVTAANNRGQFSAGPATLRLAANYRQESIVTSHISTKLRQLSDETQELAAYLVVSGNKALCVEAFEGPQMLRCSYSAGRAQPLYRGASALSLLANLPATEQTEAMSALTLDGKDYEELRRDLEITAARGFAISQGAVDPGVWGVSFPIFDGSGRLTGTLSTMAPSVRAIRSEKRLISATRAAAIILNSAENGTS